MGKIDCSSGERVIITKNDILFIVNNSHLYSKTTNKYINSSFLNGLDCLNTLNDDFWVFLVIGTCLIVVMVLFPLCKKNNTLQNTNNLQTFGKIKYKL